MWQRKKHSWWLHAFSVIWKVYAFYSTARFCQWRPKHQLSVFFGGYVVILLQFHTSYQRLGPTNGRRDRGCPPPLSFILSRFPFHLTSLPCGAFFLPNTRTLQSPRLQFSRSQTCCSFMQTRVRFLKSNTYSYVCRDFRVTCMQTDARKTFNSLQCYYIITFCMRFGTCVVGVKWLLTLQLSENHITPNLICYLILKLLLTSCLLSCILGWELLVTIIGHFSFFSCNCSTNKTCR